jgi:N-acetylmuramoyl-L-alanine amidase-like protein
MRRPPHELGDFVDAVERASRDIHDPVAKLRFIRTSLVRHQTVDGWVGRVPWAPLRVRLYRWVSLHGVQHLLTTRPFGVARPIARPARGLAASRALVAVAAVLVVAAAAGVGWRAARPEGPPVMAAVDVPAAAMAMPPVPSDPGAPLAARRAAAYGGLAPAAIWLVEKGAGFEQYSNGLRIDTSRKVGGTPREFRIFGAQGLQPELLTRPIGILFHTSESDIWPLEASFNDNLRGSSQNLLRYVRRNRLYHYVIDRFGRVYRVVAEDAKANHAGHSIWEDEGRIVLNLNHAFLGVSFETRWEGGRALPITRAQFSAGRDLADHLRYKWGIAPGMCVTHGLTSVNPKKYLIGHHVDWARGFPFAAFGLPDQYARALPSVERFGFGYDEELLAVMGDLWPGVGRGEQALGREAAQLGRGIDDVRLEKRALYDRWIADQVRDEQARAGAGGAVTRATAGRF